MRNDAPQLRDPAPAATPDRPKVLVIDDEPMVLRSWRRLLEAAGFAVEVLDDSAQVRAVLERSRPEAVVTDIGMSGLDGFGVLQAVHERAPDVPVLLATGAAHLESAIRAVEGGAFRYLEKPVDPERLVAAVTEAVRMHRIARAREEAFRVIGPEAEKQRATDEERKFESALAKRWMAYQPIHDRASGAISAYEALLRTAEPGLIRPLDFFGAAERLDRLWDVGRAVRSDVAEAIDRIPEGARVFVNLHPREIVDEELYRADAPLSRVAARIVLEITERASLTNVPDLVQRIDRLRALGYRIAVDDLGAGYAGLASFARLRPDVVKLDMSLVRAIDTDPVRRKLVGSLTRASHDLGIQVVAEGIETEPERDAIAALEVDLLQGYLLGRPARAFAAEAAPS
jgi:EAL domain-containing protein (putative c-di-GMP-specific phosphodiesterase class I)/CheY-like chemotaxis protein